MGVAPEICSVKSFWKVSISALSQVQPLTGDSSEEEVSYGIEEEETVFSEGAG